MKTKAEKRAEAETRVLDADKVSAREQLAKLDDRPGESRRERARLEGYLSRPTT